MGVMRQPAPPPAGPSQFLAQGMDSAAVGSSPASEATSASSSRPVYSNPTYVPPATNPTYAPPAVPTQAADWRQPVIQAMQSVEPKAAKKRPLSNPLLILLPILQILAAVALIVIIAVKLEDRYRLPSGIGLSVSTTVCYATTRTVNLCLYAYWAAAASIVASLLLLALQFSVKAGRRVCHVTVEVLLAVLGAAWWGAAAGVTMGYAIDANNDGLAREGWRNAAWGLCWGLCGLFGAHFLAAGIRPCCRSSSTVDDARGVQVHSV